MRFSRSLLLKSTAWVASLFWLSIAGGSSFEEQIQSPSLDQILFLTPFGILRNHFDAGHQEWLPYYSQIAERVAFWSEPSLAGATFAFVLATFVLVSHLREQGQNE